MVLKNDGRFKKDKKIKCPNNDCKENLSLKQLIEDGYLVKTKDRTIITCPHCGKVFNE